MGASYLFPSGTEGGKMQRLEYILFGYREYTAPSHVDILNLALKNRRTAAITPRGGVIISLPTARILKNGLSDIGAVPIGSPRGIGGIIARIPSHIPTLVAVLISLFLYILSTDVVFELRISGNEKLSDGEITEALYTSGFGVGSRISKTNKNAIELAVLSTCDELAWISINTRGRTAYVTVIESVGTKADPPSLTAANIVATCDCVIEEITVKRGTPVVRVGDTVRAGDLLISGIIEGAGGTEYVVAEGVVRGSSSDSIVTNTPRIYTETTTRGGTLATVTLKFFNFNINILQSYGNLPTGCDIIEENKPITLLGRRLPVSLSIGKYVEYQTKTRTLSDGELVKLTAATHNGNILSSLSGSDLVSVRTQGGFTDGGYFMESLVVFSTDIGRVIEIKTED